MVLYARHERISGDLIKELFSVESAYVLVWGALFGIALWSFIGGQVAIGALTRAEFRKLQAKNFPAYFLSVHFPSLLLLSTWLWTHPDAVPYFFTNPLAPDALQAWILFWVVGTSGANYWYVGPQVNKVMLERAEQEKKEGKAYHSETASDELKGLSERFFKLHGASWLLNMGTLGALALHGLWLGTFGPAGY